MATMIPLPPTTEVQITRVVKALYDAAPGNLYLQSFAQYAAENGGVVGVADGLLYEHRNTTNADLAQLIVDNLGLAKVDEATGATGANSAADNAKAFLLWQFNVAEQTGATRGQVLVDALNNLATLGSDPTFGKAADFFNASIAQAYSYSVDPANSTYDLAVLELADEVGVGEGGEVVPPAVPGMTFTLTAGADSLSPTAAVAGSKTTDGDDTFRAVTAGDLATVDFIDGGAGNDTLNVTAFNAPAQPVIKNVETINVTHTGAVALNLTDSSGYTALNSVGSVTGASFTGVNAAATVGIKDNAAAIAAFTVGYANVAGTADAAKVQLADANVTTLTVNSIETLTIDSAAGSLAAVTSNTVGLTADTLSTLNITGAQALTLGVTLTGGSTELKVIDASAATGPLALTSTGVAVNALNVKGGAGADTINLLSATGKAHTVDGGAGADTIILAGDKAHTVTLGAGNDVVTFGAAATNAANLAATDTTEAKLITAAIKVQDFAAGDKLVVGSAGTSKVALTGTQLADIADEVDLAAAITKAVSFGAAVDGEAYAFAFKGNTYVYVDQDAATGTRGVSANDALIQLVGYTAELTADQLALI